MKKLFSICALILCLIMLTSLTSCSNSQNMVETKSLIVDKEVKDGNQYYFYVTYHIEGMDGTFDATIKVKNKTVYDQYDIGDEYTFDRPASK